MSFKLVLALALGGLFGFFLAPGALYEIIPELSLWLLWLLLFLIGVELGRDREIFKSFGSIIKNIALVTLPVILGTMAGGVASSFILGMNVWEGLAVSAGFGWYSLSSVMLGARGAAELSVMAFFANIIRELLSFGAMPVIASKLGYLPCVAAPGAPSMDTALPVVRSCTDEETAVTAFANGVILSALVPLLVSAFYSMV